MSPFYKGLHYAIQELYGNDAVTLSDDDKKLFNRVSNAFQTAAKWLYDKKAFTPDMLSEPEPVELIKATHDALASELSAIGHKIPAEVTQTLDDNIFLFSGFKTYHEMNDASRLLKDDDGGFKPFGSFLQDIQSINSQYNQNYLYAEYNFAKASTQMAVKWHDIEKDGDDYNLQYRTASDGLVRPEHAALEGVTLPPSDKFWNEYYPPNGWNCRCTAVQVLKDKYAASDSDQACAAGERATTQIGKNGENKAEMFRFNPGKAGKVFPPKHPYYKAPKDAATKIKATSKQVKINDIVAELPDNLTNDEKQELAKHYLEIEKKLHVLKGDRMTIDDADKQHANPNYGTNKGYRTNCQTCAPTYVLRTAGFDVTAKSRTPRSKQDYLAKGHCWEAWKNLDGTAAKHSSVNDWMASKGYTLMTPDRYKEYFNETCKDEGIYQVCIGWKRGGGHVTILQRLSDGSLQYIEPQLDNSSDRSIDYLCKNGETNHLSDRRGVMRVDNKLFNTDFISIFNK